MRLGKVFWGIVLAAAGVILLLQNFGVISVSFWPIFWALLIILAGVWILLGPMLAKRGYDVQSLSIPLEGASEASVVLKHGTGRIQLRALQTSGELLAGTFAGGVEQKVERGTITQVELTPPMSEAWTVPFLGGHTGFNWELGLNKDLPISLKIESGAGEAALDLSELQVREFRIDTGASSSDITLPARAGTIRAAIHAGAASVKVRVPQGVAASIHMDTGLTGCKVDTVRFPNLGGQNYRSTDYDNAANRVEIHVEAGVGSIEIL